MDHRNMLTHEAAYEVQCNVRKNEAFVSPRVIRATVDAFYDRWENDL